MFDYDPRVAPQQALKSFLDDVQKLMDRVAGMEEADEFYPVLPQDLQTPFHEAWKDARSDIGTLKRKLAERDQEYLAKHGLAGDQLAFKLSAVSWVYQRFEEPLGPGELGRLFDTLEPLLDTLIAAFGGKSTVKELKETVRSLLPFW